MHCTTLANGLRVASRPMQSVETVAVGLYARTGSRFEPAGKNGLAHLFEHMVFKGAGGRSAREISELVEDVGGDLNASTDRETTAFYASLLADDLALGIDLLADLVRRPHFEPKHLALEKKVVLQELAEVGDTPSDLVFDLLQDAAFPDQPLGRPVLGTAETIAATTVDDLHAWLRDHYPAASLLLVGAGKLEHDALVDQAERAFGSMAAGSRPGTAEPGRFVGGRGYAPLNGPQAHLALAMSAPAWGASDHFAAQLFADVVGGGASCHLFQRLREDQGLAYSVSAGVSAFADTGLFFAYAAADKSDADHALREIEAVIAEAAETLSQRDLDRARAMAKAGMMMSLESCWGQASFVANRLLRDGNYAEPARIVEQLDSVTLEAVRAAGKQMLSGPRAFASVGASLALAA